MAKLAHSLQSSGLKKSRLRAQTVRVQGRFAKYQSVPSHHGALMDFALNMMKTKSKISSIDGRNCTEWIGRGPKEVIVKRILLFLAIVVLASIASSGSDCDQSPYCVKVDNPGDSGTLVLGVTGCWIQTAVIKAGQGEHAYQPPLEDYDDGNYRVTVTDTVFTWSTLAGKEVSHVQLWYACDSPATFTPEPTETNTPEPTGTIVPTPTDQPTDTPDPTSTTEPTVTTEPTPFQTPTPWNTPQCTSPNGCNGLG